MKPHLSLILGLFLIASSLNGVHLEKDDSSESSSEFEPLKTLTKPFSDMFRIAQASVLGYTEKLLDQSADMYDDFSEIRSNIRNSSDERSSKFKKALRYLKQRARHMREDIEDEIEIEREKQESMEASEKKESESRIAKLTEAVGKLREVSSKRLFPKARSKIVRSVQTAVKSRILSHLQNRKHEDNPPKKVESEVESEVASDSAQSCQSVKTENEEKPKTSDEEQLTTIGPATMSLGDGFGRHM